MKSLRRHPFITGAIISLIGIIAFVLPMTNRYEIDLGLQWMFQLRGKISAPAEVVVISIDRESSVELGLPNLPRKWPRRYHAELIDTLTEAGASIIGFDIIFNEERDLEDDVALSKALKKSGNVLLFEYIQNQFLGQSANDEAIEYKLEKRIPPIPILAEHALDTAPFTLPKIPERVNQAWLFKTSAGDTPTLPVVAIHEYCRAELSHLHEWLYKHSKITQHTLPERPRNRVNYWQKEIFTNDALMQMIRSEYAPSQPLKNRHCIDSIRHIAQSGESIFINFYGPARSVTTIPYHHVLTNRNTQKSLKDKIVLVGFSERFQPEQRDGFYTVYTGEDGLDISGVEIMATTVSNLWDKKSIQILHPLLSILLLIIFSFTTYWLLWRYKGKRSIVISLAILSIHIIASYYCFAKMNYLLPFIIPLFIQLPLALVISQRHQYTVVSNEKSTMENAFKQYVPESLVNKISLSNSISVAQENLNGACLSTDIENYTTLSESLSAQELHDLMNQYYEIVVDQVIQHGGIVSDITADASMSIWIDKDEQQQKTLACQAAIAIQAAIDKLERTIPTRIGIHYGSMTLGNIGAKGNYYYRPMGDILNTTSRIEGLNKYLQTKVLASDIIVEDNTKIVARKIGNFLVKGKSSPIDIYEVLPEDTSTELLTVFAQATEAYHERQWIEALEIFGNILSAYPEDGPSLFYMDKCLDIIQRPLDLHSLVHKMDEK